MQFSVSYPQHGLTNMAGQPCWYVWSSVHAADVGNPDFRQRALNYINSKTQYTGPYLDDVNMNIDTVGCGGGSGSSSNACPGDGSLKCPKDPRTGQVMTKDAWAKYFAEFLEQIKGLGRPVIHNAQPYDLPIGNPYQDRQQRAATYVEVEHNFVNSWVSPTWLWTWIDSVHANGAGVLDQGYKPNFEGISESEKRYGVAAHMLTMSTKDFYSAFKNGAPDDWDGLYDKDLGQPLGSRYQSGGEWRRDFQGGTVRVNTSNRTAVIP
jgi:hypothetical protein